MPRTLFKPSKSGKWRLLPKWHRSTYPLEHESQAARSSFVYSLSRPTEFMSYLITNISFLAVFKPITSKIILCFRYVVVCVRVCVCVCVCGWVWVWRSWAVMCFKLLPA